MLQNIGSLEELFHDEPAVLSKRTGIKAPFFESMERENALLKSIDVVDFHANNGISTSFYQSEEYPFKLNQCLDAPLHLFLKGTIDFNHGNFVAIVGTRDATEYGKIICRDLVKSLVGKNITVVSGLAYGIDAWAHHYCLEFGVPTIAVLGHGLDRIYPVRHRQLAKDILSCGGALVSEFVPGTIPDRENFPKRNRIVAGLCDATIVVESKVQGGSLITADLANDYNRDVFAFPGSILCETSAGCNQLIAEDKAHLLASADGFLRHMGWEDEKQIKPVQRKAFSDFTDNQQRILNHLKTAEEIEIDRLSILASMPISKLNSELLLLELEGAVCVRPGNRYKYTA
jgi:DNA processing protein